METRDQAKKTRALLQRKIYRCPYCGEPHAHDDCYAHALYLCPQRPGSTVNRG